MGSGKGLWIITECCLDRRGPMDSRPTSSGGKEGIGAP